VKSFSVSISKEKNNKLPGRTFA